MLGAESHIWFFRKFNIVMVVFTMEVYIGTTRTLLDLLDLFAWGFDWRWLVNDTDRLRVRDVWKFNTFLISETSGRRSGR